MKTLKLILEKSLLVLLILPFIFFQSCNPNEDTGENLTPGDLLDLIDNSHDIYFLDNNTLYGVRDNNDPSTQSVGQMEQFMEVKIPSIGATIATPIALKVSDNLNNEAGGYGPIKMVVASRDGLVYLYDIPGGDLVWQLNLSEELRSTPSYISFENGNIRNAYLYVGSTRGTFYCIDANSGSIVWTFEEPNGASFESSTSSNRTGIVSVATNTGTLYTFDRAGNLLWSFATLSLMQSKPMLYVTPTNNGLSYELNSVLGGTVDGIVFRLDGTTGNEVWSRSLGDPIVSAPFIIPEQNRVGNSVGFFVTTLGRKVHRIRMDSGNVDWLTELDASIFSTPVQYPDESLSTNASLYISSQKTLYSIDLISLGSENWSLPLYPPMYSTPNIVSSRNNGSGTRCYINSVQGLTGINAETGEIFSQFLTNSNQPAESENINFQSSPVIIYSESDTGTADIYNPKNVL